MVAQPGYRTLLAGLPWNLGQVGDRGRGAATRYSLTSVERITAWPVQCLIADNAHLWLSVRGGGPFPPIQTKHPEAT